METYRTTENSKDTIALVPEGGNYKDLESDLEKALDLPRVEGVPKDVMHMQKQIDKELEKGYEDMKTAPKINKDLTATCFL